MSPYFRFGILLVFWTAVIYTIMFVMGRCVCIDCTFDVWPGEDLCIFHMHDKDPQVFTQHLASYIAVIDEIKDTDIRLDWVKKLATDSLKNYYRAQLLERVQFLYDFQYFVFPSGVNFENAVFSNTTLFDKAVFIGEVSFKNAHFSGTSFWSTKFHNRVSFSSAVFENNTTFGCAVFSEEADFTEATFKGPVEFYRTWFHSNVIFESTEFKDKSDFYATRLDDYTSFQRALFLDEVIFAKAEVSQIVDFSGSFINKCKFEDLKLLQHTIISEAVQKQKFKTFNFVVPQLLLWDIRFSDSAPNIVFEGIDFRQVSLLKTAVNYDRERMDFINVEFDEKADNLIGDVFFLQLLLHHWQVYMLNCQYFLYQDVSSLLFSKIKDLFKVFINSPKDTQRLQEMVNLDVIRIVTQMKKYFESKGDNEIALKFERLEEQIDTVPLT